MQSAIPLRARKRELQRGGSLRLNAGRADDPSPFRRVFDDEFTEFDAGHWSWHAAKLSKSRLYLGVGQTSDGRIAEVVELRGWFARQRRRDAVMLREVRERVLPIGLPPLPESTLAVVGRRPMGHDFAGQLQKV